MSDKNSKTQSGGIGFFGLLGIVFITLKLTGVIAWKWWVVLLPLWGPFSIAAVVVFTVLIVKGLLK
jgi:ABC-type siderophore export system fused ATPase/permease subunit